MLKHRQEVAFIDVSGAVLLGLQPAAGLRSPVYQSSCCLTKVTDELGLVLGHDLRLRGQRGLGLRRPRELALLFVLPRLQGAFERLERTHTLSHTWNCRTLTLIVVQDSELVTHSVPRQRLRPVLVDDLDVTWRLDPGLAVHLHGDALVSQDGDLHCATLRKRDTTASHNV